MFAKGGALQGCAQWSLQLCCVLMQLQRGSLHGLQFFGGGLPLWDSCACSFPECSCWWVGGLVLWRRAERM